MTAKEELIGIIEGWSEDEAEKWLCAIEPERSHREELKFLTTTELLRLPKAERSAVIKAQLALLTPEELQQDLEEWEEREAGTGSDINLIDERGILPRYDGEGRTDRDNRRLVRG